MRNLMMAGRGLILAELVAILLWVTPFAKAEINSNSMVLDGIEYYIQTDKSVYNLGEDVEMLYRVTNQSSENVTFSFTAFPAEKFYVEQDGEQIWQSGGPFLPDVYDITILPGVSIYFPDDTPPHFLWHMKDNGNNLVDTGTYNIVGGLFRWSGIYDYTKVDVSIDIVPEPSIVFLLTIGILGIRVKSK